jgi:hypothetical protein
MLVSRGPIDYCHYPDDFGRGCRERQDRDGRFGDVVGVMAVEQAGGRTGGDIREWLGFVPIRINP